MERKIFRVAMTSTGVLILESGKPPFTEFGDTIGSTDRDDSFWGIKNQAKSIIFNKDVFDCGLDTLYHHSVKYLNEYFGE